MSTSVVWTYDQLAALGVTDAQLKRQVSDGEVVRLRRGVYALGEGAGALDDHRRRLRATSLEVDPTSVFSHISAAVLHGLPVPMHALKEVTLTRRSSGHGDHSGLIRVRRTSIESDEITLVDGLPVTTVARTVSDLARTEPFEWGLAAADAALHAGASRGDLELSVNRHPRLHGVKRARQVIARADSRAESPAESMSRFHMMRLGLPEPELQFEIYDEDGQFVGRADFGWPDHGLVGEVDGRVKYQELLRPGQSAADVVMAEKRREQRIRACGFWVVRWGWREATDGEALRELLLAGFASASPLRRPRRGEPPRRRGASARVPTLTEGTLAAGVDGGRLPRRPG